MTSSPNPFVDFTSMLKQFNLPGVDMAAIIEARRKDIDALMQANQSAYDGMQALSQKQAEILRATMEEMQDSIKGMTPGAMASSAKPKEFAEQAVKKALDNMQELAHMAQQSQAEALRIINQRAMQNIEELKGLMRPK